jgi:hypothetical protein
MNSITLNQDQLKSAIAEWETLNRSGGTQGADAMAAKSVEEVASESAQYLWGVLQEIVSH